MTYKMPFGQYKHMTIAEMLKHDPDYAAWLYENGWVREKFKRLYATLHEAMLEGTATPDHNALQTLFLDPGYREAFILHTCPGLIYDAVGAMKPGAGGFRLESVVKFESNSVALNADVEIRWRCAMGDPELTILHGRQDVEVKPTVGDDYPCILRRMAPPSGVGADYLFVDQYTGKGATEEQFVRIFQLSGKIVVWKRDVDEVFAHLPGSQHKEALP
jgi:Putative quorum-sensing-regulated virulence factor